jgi:cation:H+ antiporter
LTVVAAGTSTPELVVSIQSALNGSGGIAVGNVVGSNIFNVGAILGLAALVSPLRVTGNTVRMGGHVNRCVNAFRRRPPPRC